MEDKSTTHVKVMKNGHEDWIPNEVWKHAKENNDTNGFIEVANMPLEVEELIKSKKPIENTDSITGEVVEVKKRSKKTDSNEG